MNSDFLSSFTKSGFITTDATGIFNVVFQNQIPNDVHYSVLLTCGDIGQTAAFATNVTQTGFTITTWNTQSGGGGAIRA